MIKNDLVPPVAYEMPVNASGEVLRQQDLIQTLAQYVSRDHAGGVRWLLSDDANVGAITEGMRESPFSSLHYAAARNKQAALMAMIERLPLTVWNLRARESGQTPLMLAAEQGNHEMALQLFLRLHTHVSTCQRMPRDAGDRELHALAQAYGCHASDSHGDRGIWRRIVNARDHDGNTALLLAVKSRRLACSNMLLELTADPEIPNHRGESARSVVLKLPAGAEMRLLLDGAGPAHEHVSPVRLGASSDSQPSGGLRPIRFARRSFTMV